MKRACTDEQIKARKQEIIDATNQMLETMDYQDISMKTISEHISIARSSLYCYYTCKEEIMLDILTDEYSSWINNLISFLNDKIESVEKIAEGITNIYLSHTRLLKMVSIHSIDIINHCSVDKLIEYKSDYLDLNPVLLSKIKLQFPNATELDLKNITNSLAMLTYGLYPQVHPFEQKYNVMKLAGVETNDDASKYCYDYLLFIFSKIK